MTDDILLSLHPLDAVPGCETDRGCCVEKSDTSNCRVFVESAGCDRVKRRIQYGGGDVSMVDDMTSYARKALAGREFEGYGKLVGNDFCSFQQFGEL